MVVYTSSDIHQTSGKLGLFGHSQYKITKDQPLLRCISKEVCNATLLLVNKNLKMYTELQKNPPFPAWKTDLDEVWN